MNDTNETLDVEAEPPARKFERPWRCFTQTDYQGGLKTRRILHKRAHRRSAPGGAESATDMEGSSWVETMPQSPTTGKRAWSAVEAEFIEAELARRSPPPFDPNLEMVKSKRFLSEVMAADLDRLNMARESQNMDQSAADPYQADSSSAPRDAPTIPPSSPLYQTPAADRGASTCFETPASQCHPVWGRSRDAYAIRRLTSPPSPSSAGSSLAATPTTCGRDAFPAESPVQPSSNPAVSLFRQLSQEGGGGTLNMAGAQCTINTTPKSKHVLMETVPGKAPTSPSDPQFGNHDLRRTALLRALLQRTVISDKDIGNIAPVNVPSLLGGARRSFPASTFVANTDTVLTSPSTSRATGFCWASVATTEANMPGGDRACSDQCMEKVGEPRMAMPDHQAGSDGQSIPGSQCNNKADGSLHEYASSMDFQATGNGIN
mmetsp:Transcript_33064/g.93582  ORF Transcript_33064/g.93582 Transcript_33064/m.93582 type:complete len:433 (-) Transcript_33064:806-2104(-)